MGKKHTIKDIAALAGVSAGTVDRVLHNRGDVSIDSRLKVEKALAEINYSHNLIMPMLLEATKQFTILIIMPQHMPDEYWERIENGIQNAIRDFAKIKLKIKYLYYDQFDLYSCRKSFNEALSLKADAVIIGPSFHDETVLFANQLFMKNIPYIFVDTAVNNTNPLAFYGPHSFQTGIVQAKLLAMNLEQGKDIVLFQAKRVGDETSIQSLSRANGFISYIKENHPNIKIFSAEYDNADKSKKPKLVDDFFREHPNVGGAVVFNSRAYIIADYLEANNMTNVKLVGYGTNKRNIMHLKSGFISFIISERPEYQGYKAVRTTLEYLLYNKTYEVWNYTPIDILTKETVDFYAV